MGTGLEDEVERLMLARSANSIRRDDFPVLSLIMESEGTESDDFIAAAEELVARASSHLADPKEGEAARHLLVRGDNWAPLSQRGSDAAASLGISYDGLRRKGVDGGSRLGRLLGRLAAVLDQEYSPKIGGRVPRKLGGERELAAVASRQSSVFLSYSRDDDLHVGGLISAIRESLVRELRFQTGVDIEVFQDTASISFGEQWKRRIQEALDGTVILLAVMTPSFLASAACREEVERFVRREREQGRDDLVIPLYLATIGTPSSDPLAEQLMGHQWADWRDLRFADASSREFQVAIAELAQQVIMAMARAGTGPQDALSEFVDSAGDDALHEDVGALELIAQMELAMPRMTRALTAIALEIQGMGTDFEAAMARVTAMTERGQGAVAMVLVVNDLGKALEPRAEKIDRLGGTIGADLDDVGGGMSQLAHRLRTNPTDAEELDQARDLAHVIHETASVSRTAYGEVQSMVASTYQLEGMSSKLKPPLRKIRRGLEFMTAVPERFEVWARELDEAVEACASAETKL